MIRREFILDTLINKPTCKQLEDHEYLDMLLYYIKEAQDISFLQKWFLMDNRLLDIKLPISDNFFIVDAILAIDPRCSDGLKNIIEDDGMQLLQIDKLQKASYLDMLITLTKKATYSRNFFLQVAKLTPIDESNKIIEAMIQNHMPIVDANYILCNTRIDFDKLQDSYYMQYLNILIQCDTFCYGFFIQLLRHIKKIDLYTNANTSDKVKQSIYDLIIRLIENHGNDHANTELITEEFKEFLDPKMQNSLFHNIVIVMMVTRHNNQEMIREIISHKMFKTILLLSRYYPFRDTNNALYKELIEQNVQPIGHISKFFDMGR